MLRHDLRLFVILLACATGFASGCSDDGGGGDGTIGGDGDGTGDTGGACTPGVAIVTDIDETLTLSDAEFLMQVQDGTYDPLMRDGASDLVTGYADLGYRVLYLTARSETLTLGGTGESARDATERWLTEHDFPVDPATTEVILAPSVVFGADASAYKSAAIMGLQDDGWVFEYAYGNADSDITAYADAMIAKDHTFIIGDQAGSMGTVGVAGEGWVDHAAMQLPMVEPGCP